MTTHTPHRQAHRPPPSMVMAAILAIVAGLLGAAGAAQAVPQEPTEPTDPTEKVITISDLVVPVYGDALTFKVKAGGRDNVLYVYDGTEVLVGPVTMGNTPARSRSRASTATAPG